MTEVTEEVQEESVTDIAQDEADQKEEKVEKVELSREARLMVLNEIQTLNQLINTKFYLPKFNEQSKNVTKGNNNMQPKINGSVELSYYSNQQMKVWGNKVIELTQLL